MTKVTLPTIQQPLVDSTGRCNVIWFEKLKFLEGLQPLSDVPAIVPPPPITPGNTTVSVTNRSVADTLNIGTGVDASLIGYASTVQSLYDSFTTIKNVINSFNTNHTNSKNAIDALNTRVTALENKVNAIISALS